MVFRGHSGSSRPHSGIIAGDAGRWPAAFLGAPAITNQEDRAHWHQPYDWEEEPDEADPAFTLRPWRLLPRVGEQFTVIGSTGRLLYLADALREIVYIVEVRRSYLDNTRIRHNAEVTWRAIQWENDRALRGHRRRRGRGRGRGAASTDSAWSQ